ncbi:hypothetical protein ACFVVM_03200 [Nocardia sp. NPDC058176]|uniref:hypothetical protein n=1 Tax=Nocardia sp. NPDC058176 TaxID=3346368 RepID=UPI0036DAB9CF
MRVAIPAVLSMVAAVLLTGCAIPTQGPDQTERDSWSRAIETAIQALPGVVDASHLFDYEGKSRTYHSRLAVQLEDDATPDEAAAVVRTMGAQPLPSQYEGDQTEVDLDRMPDSFTANWRFGRDVSREATSAHAWARLSAPGTQVDWLSRGNDVNNMSNAIRLEAGSEAEPHHATAAMRRIIQDFPELAPNEWTMSTVSVESGSDEHSKLGPGWHNPGRRLPTPPDGRRFPSDRELDLWEWFLTDQSSPFIVDISIYDPSGRTGRTMDVEIHPPAGQQITAAQAIQLAERHLPYLAQPGAVIDYTIGTSVQPVFAVFIGGCQPSWREVPPESQPYARQYERC